MVFEIVSVLSLECLQFKRMDRFKSNLVGMHVYFDNISLEIFFSITQNLKVTSLRQNYKILILSKSTIDFVKILLKRSF